MTRFLTGLFDRIFAVVGAFFFCQLPEFMLQYQARLAGHLGECTHQLLLLKQNADLTGKPLEAYIQKFLQQGDPDFVRQGQFMMSVTDRHAELQHAVEVLATAPSWWKPIVFIRHCDLGVVESTWNTFTFGFAFNLESLCYALAGLFFGVLVFALFRKFLSFIASCCLAPFHRKSKPLEAQTTPPVAL